MHLESRGRGGGAVAGPCQTAHCPPLLCQGQTVNQSIVAQNTKGMETSPLSGRGRAQGGERPIGAASCRQHHNQMSCQPPSVACMEQSTAFLGHRVECRDGEQCGRRFQYRPHNCTRSSPLPHAHTESHRLPADTPPPKPTTSNLKYQPAKPTHL